METKYDRFKAAQSEREIRANNIEALGSELREARLLLSVINGMDFDAIRERNTVKAKIRDLAELIEDEQRAYASTFEDPQNAEKAVTMILSRFSL